MLLDNTPLQHQDALTMSRGEVVTSLVSVYKALSGGYARAVTMSTPIPARRWPSAPTGTNCLRAPRTCPRLDKLTLSGNVGNECPQMNLHVADDVFVGQPAVNQLILLRLGPGGVIIFLLVNI